MTKREWEKARQPNQRGKKRTDKLDMKEKSLKCAHVFVENSEGSSEMQKYKPKHVN